MTANPMRNVLWFALAAVSVSPGFAGLAGIAGGAPAGWGVLLGLLLPAVFFGATALVAAVSAPKSPTSMAAIVLGSWLVKIIAFIAVLFWLRDQDFYSREWFLGAFAAGVILMLAGELVIVKRAQVPYVEPQA